MCHIYIFNVYFNIRRRLRAVVASLGVIPNSTHLWEIGLMLGHRMSLVLCFHLFDKKGWTSWLWHSLSALRNSVILNFMPKHISVQFSCSVMSNSLWPHELQHARPPGPSPTPRVYPNSCPLSRWCHPTISSSFIPFSSGPQSFPASGSFPMSQLFASGGQSYWSFSFNINPSNEYSGLISFRMDWLDLLAVQGTLKSLLQHHSSKASILQSSAIL